MILHITCFRLNRLTAVGNSCLQPIINLNILNSDKNESIFWVYVAPLLLKVLIELFHVLLRIIHSFYET